MSELTGMVIRFEQLVNIDRLMRHFSIYTEQFVKSTVNLR